MSLFLKIFSFTYVWGWFQVFDGNSFSHCFGKNIEWVAVLKTSFYDVFYFDKAQLSKFFKEQLIFILFKLALFQNYFG